MRRSNILLILGIMLYFLVMSVLYLVILINENLDIGVLKFFQPLIFLSGLFLFLIGAVMIAISLSRIV